MTTINISRHRRKSFTGVILFVITLFLLLVIQAWADDYDGPEAGASLIGAVRLIPESSYVGVPQLLEKYIKEDNETAWATIKEKINYTHTKLGNALWPVLRKNDLQSKIFAEIKAGKKLFFKPNLVTPEVLSLSGDGSPGLRTGVVACTDWAFVAALMRFFHDELGIRYYQMALGEAGTVMPAYSHLLQCTPEALIEGCGFPLPDGKVFHAGWCMNWIRKYLAETTTPHDSKDDPQNGYSDSVQGNYVTPGQATAQGKLMVYDLNNAEWFDRGRRVDVPDGGDNYKEGIVLHKAIVGDPEDTENYPGSVMVNMPMFKVHGLTTLTNAIKNFGIGAWPMCAGQDSNVKTTDWLYSYPPDSPPGLKGGVPGWAGGHPWRGKGLYHERYYVVEANDEGIPLKITDKPNQGLDGTMVDVNLAINSQVPHVLHVVDGVNVIDIEHGGGGNGVAREEGLILASTDPVALDLLCSRYMFKNSPRDGNSPDTFARGVPLPRYDEALGAIVTDPGVDQRLLRSTLFDYAARRGLGELTYYVEGKDETSPASAPLVSKDGHFGKMEDGKFSEIMTDTLYFHRFNILWDLQTPVLAYAKATDRLSGSNYYGEFMALDEDKNGIIDDSEFGRKGSVDGVIALLGIDVSLIGKGEVEHGIFFFNSRYLKYADPAWNVDKLDTFRVLLDAGAFPVALQMATDKENQGTDPFFGIPYGAADGAPKWPSLQFARYSMEMFIIYEVLYSNAGAYSEKTGKPFKLFVPSQVPYAPATPSDKPPWGYNPQKLSNVVELDPQDPDYSKLVFTVEFSEAW